MRISRLRFFFVASLLVLIMVMPVTATAQGESPIPNLEVILIIDESFSMNETDPMDRRLDAVELFVNTLGVDLSQADFRVALIAFNNGAQLIGDGFVSLKDPGAREQLISSYDMERQKAQGYTDVLAGFQLARELLNQHQEGYKPVVMIISDGKPETEFANEKDAPDGVADYLQNLEAFAADAFDDVGYNGAQCSSSAKGTPIYTIAIRHAILPEDYPPELKDLWLRMASFTGGSYRENISDDDTQFQKNLQTIFTEFLREWLCVQVDDSGFLPLPLTQTFEVNDSHAQIIFSIAKTDPDAQVQILNAAGQALVATPGSVNRNQSALSESWAILRPPDRQGWTGTWTVNITGQGEASLSPIFITDMIRLNFISPSVGVLPLGADFVIQTEILNKNDQPLSPDLILSSEITLTGPDNQPLASDQPTILPNGRLLSVIPAPTQEGRYQINVNATVAAGENQIPLQQTRFVELSRLLPWLNVTSPIAGASYPSGTFTPLEVILMLQFEELDGAINRNEVRAELYRVHSSGSARDAVGQYDLTLQPDREGPGHFGGQLPDDLPLGAYELDVILLSQPLGGQEYEAPPRSISFTIENVPTVTPLPAALPSATIAPTPSALPTVVIVPATITPTPAPSKPLVLDIPPQLLLSCGLLIFLFALGLIIILFFRNRPSLARIGLEDISSYPNPTNEVVFSSSDIRSYFSRTVTIRDQDDAELAQLRLSAEKSGPIAEVLHVTEGAELRIRNAIYDEGDTFYPENGNTIEIRGTANNVLLRFDVPEKENDYYN